MISNFIKTRLIDKISQRLHTYSISDLTLLIIKLVSVGFALFLITYLVTGKITSHYQSIIDDKVLPMTVLQRDIGNNIVGYLLIQDEIFQSKETADHKVTINTHADKTYELLDKLHTFVSSEEEVLNIKNSLDMSHSLLVDSILNVDIYHGEKVGINKQLMAYKQDVKAILDNIIVLREQLSGKIALETILNKDLDTDKANNLVQANLMLGMKISNLVTNISILMYVDNIDELNDLNVNQIYQNVKQTKRSLDALQALTDQSKSLLKINRIVKDIALLLVEVELRVSMQSSLSLRMQEDFEVKSLLETNSRSVKNTLSEIEGYLMVISKFSNNKVKEAIYKSKTVSLVSTTLFIVISLVFIFILVGLISIIARKINDPIKTLNGTMRRLTHGDLSARLEVDQSISDEFSELWDDFNSFAEENQKTITQQEIIFDNADIGIAWIIDRKCLQVNKKMLDIFGYGDEELLERDIGFLYCYDTDYLEVGTLGYGTLSRGEAFSAEYKMRKKDGSHFWCKLTGKSIDSGSNKNSIWLFEDVSETKVAEEKLFRLANFDSLTKLANRSMFGLHLDEAISTSNRLNKQFSLLFIDIDRFKHINDSLGHEAGDLVLSEASKRMQSVLRGSDIIARLGGDEFTIILDDVSDIASVSIIANKILRALSSPMAYKGKEIYTGCSIGISRFPQDGIVKSELLSCADSAMYDAKKSGRNRYSFYSEEIGESNQKDMLLSQELKKAVEHKEFELHYQPKIDMKTREIIGAEALLRWNKPNEGFIPPCDFIPILEEIGLMPEVGEWVIYEVCNTIKMWMTDGYDPGKVAINLSERQFSSDLLLENVEKILKDTEIPADKIEFEITESLMMSDSQQTMDILHGIKKLGIDIAMDDFGTGYSSLAYLKIFPIDILKIDRAFVKDITEDSNDEAIIEAIIAMAKQLNLTMVAEGIETENQYEFLHARGCEIGQGYLFSKPIPAERMLQLYKNN